MESQALVTDWTWRWVAVRGRGLMMPRALAGLSQPVTAQVAEEQGGCCCLSQGVLKGRHSLTAW